MPLYFFGRSGVAYDPTMADTPPAIERGDLLIRFWLHGVDIPFGWEHLDVRPQNRQRICRMADGTERWDDGIHVYKNMVFG